MNLRTYIYHNYKIEYNKELPKSLSLLLESFCAKDINLDSFIKEFSLEEKSFSEILNFIIDDSNAYVLAKYGYRNYETKKNPLTLKRKPSKYSTYDNYSYGEPGKFTKRFK